MLDSALPPFDATPRTRLVFGPGTLSRLGDLAKELGATSALVVTDQGLIRAGHAGRAVESLRSVGIQTLLYPDVRENPTTLDVERCLAVARSAPIDLLIGLGGGSSMDTAKGTNFILTNGGAMRDYWGVGKATRPMLPLIAIPTTAGTGSECQSAALIADESTHQKMACLDPKAAARVAILDPELTLSMPRSVTAVTGIDAIAHALETAVTRKRTPLSCLYSAAAFQLLFGSLPRVLADPTNLEAHSSMLLGAAYAGTAIELSMLGAAHAAANPLTAHFNIVHGAAVGLMLPAVIRFNAGIPSVAAAYAHHAIQAGIVGPHVPISVAVRFLVEATLDLVRTAGLPASIAAAGVPPSSLPMLAAEAARQWTAGFNPRPVSAAEFESLYAAS